MRSTITGTVILFVVAGWCVAAQQTELRIEKLMTAEELQETGVSSLTAAQRAALSRWLERYTRLVASAARSMKNSTPDVEPGDFGRSACIPSVESTIAGAFQGWSGETIFKLDNGQISQQAEYDYMYSYQYRPDVTIYSTSSGCRMTVEDEDETILVKRIK